jgi:hypothetical protein
MKKGLLPLTGTAFLMLVMAPIVQAEVMARNVMPYLHELKLETYEEKSRTDAAIARMPGDCQAMSAKYGPLLTKIDGILKSPKLPVDGKQAIVEIRNTLIWSSNTFRANVRKGETMQTYQCRVGLDSITTTEKQIGLIEQALR